jgi:hypothetical protein
MTFRSPQGLHSTDSNLANASVRSAKMTPSHFPAFLQAYTRVNYSFAQNGYDTKHDKDTIRNWNCSLKRVG